MLSVLVTLWATSLVVLAVLLAGVIAAQAAWAWLRRLGASWSSRTRTRRPVPVARTSVRA